MANGKLIMISMVVALVIMGVFALYTDSNVPTAAVTYGFTLEEIEQARTCERLGGTPWVTNEVGEKFIKCEIEPQ